MCEFNCYLEDSCQSYNLASMEQDGTWECQLSSSNDIQHPESLVSSPTKTYHATENPCNHFPCTKNATCKPHFLKDDSYTCICPVGFQGQSCNTDMDECSIGSHNCSVNAMCDNIVGSFNCACSLGFAGDGVNCTAVKKGFGPEIPAQSCKEVFDDTPMATNGPYYLQFNNREVQRTYCHVDDIPGCGVGPWTLVMKINGHHMTFTYSSSLWSDLQSYNLEGGVTGFDDKETKMPSYWSTSFTKLCLGMNVNGVTNWLSLNTAARSLHSLIADGNYRATSVGRDAWKSLIVGSKLQQICNKEGFNTLSEITVGGVPTAARIGIIANDIFGCVNCDSRLGFGTAGSFIPQDNSNSCGNEAAWMPFISDSHIKAHCYILVQ
ncbi:uncharacterized protein LOC144661935 [Oculina patagonica]